MHYSLTVGKQVIWGTCTKPQSTSCSFGGGKSSISTRGARQPYHPTIDLPRRKSWSSYCVVDAHAVCNSVCTSREGFFIAVSASRLTTSISLCHKPVFYSSCGGFLRRQMGNSEETNALSPSCGLQQR